MRWIGTLTLLTAATLLSSAVFAAQGTASREAFYRCKDKKGQTHYGDSMPPLCAGMDTEVLNERGMTMRVIEGEQTRAARLEREKGEARARQLRDEALLRDRTLIDTYLTVEDIERLRDQRLELLAAQYRVTEQNITNLLDRQSRLETQIARFKPYATQSSAPPLPDHLAEEMVNTVNGLEVYRKSLARNRQEQADIKAAFDADIKRFKELKGLK
jgi:Domain of unknown function (DUF4124)